jgi:hypothetical protein
MMHPLFANHAPEHISPAINNDSALKELLAAYEDDNASWPIPERSWSFARAGTATSRPRRWSGMPGPRTSTCPPPVSLSLFPSVFDE